jgi:two-component system sensor histidine kinase KdpD
VEAAGTGTRYPVLAQYGASLCLVAAATFLAFVASTVVPAPGLTLIFVLPVVIAGTAFGLGPSVAATLVGILAFDFFYTQPIYTFRMTDPSDIWAAGLLLITAVIVSTVSWQSRRYALDARRAAAHAEELRQLAHAVIEGASQSEIVQAAATALSRIFGGPAVVLSNADGGMRVEASAGGAEMSEDEMRAAEAARASGIRMRADTYPNDQSRFDMWPVAAGTSCQYVVGVDFGRAKYERPVEADQLVEIAAGYLINPTRQNR